VATAICRRAYSRLEAGLRAVLTAGCLAWFLSAGPALAFQVRLDLGAIDHPAFSASGVALKFDAVRRGAASIDIERLQLAGSEYRAVRLSCNEFEFDGRRLNCPAGLLHRAGEEGETVPPLPFSLTWRKDGHLDLTLRELEAVALSPLVKHLPRWQPVGHVDLHLRIDKDTARLDLTTDRLSFRQADGMAVGKNLAFVLRADARREADGWRWQAGLDWRNGVFELPPWQRKARMRIDAAGRLTPAQLEVESARLAVDGLGAVTASLRWDREQGRTIEWGLVSERIDLAAAQREWLQPWLSGLGFPVWQAAGDVLFAAEWREGRLRRFYAGLENASLRDATDYLALDGLDAQVPWEDGAETDAEIGVAAGRLGDLPLGAFRIPLRLKGETARIEALAAPLLDGRLEVDSLFLQRTGSDWNAELSGGIEGVSMAKLSQALKLPRMAGALTARIPRIAYENNVLHMDGAIGIEVFDGGMIVHQLRMLDPFSANRRLRVDVAARGLDLGMLTRTFAFGSIEGRFDADLQELELDGWRPVRFDARIASSEGDHPRSLSLGALKDITELGDPGKHETIQRLPERGGLGLGYRRIGLGCKLRDGVCELTGIEGRDTPERVLIMEGSGIPSIDILGYNRRIDWDALVARFREVLAGRPGFVIE
jgi:hypothetical protein